MRFVSCNQLFDMLGSGVNFDHTVRNFYNRRGHAGERFPVRMDLLREKEAFKILAELPGMEKDKIKIMVEEGILTISGERTRDKDNEIVRSERFHGSFTRSFKLPDTIEKSGISADYNNGLLEVTLPVKAEEKPKQIEVRVS